MVDFFYFLIFLSLQNCRYSFGLGYGLSMTANAGLAPVVAKMQKRTDHSISQPSSPVAAVALSV